MMVPGLEVRHIFNFNLKKSLGNAFRKSMYWTVYSMSNRDLFTDSGAASSELKVNVAANAAAYLLALAWFVSGASAALIGIPALVILNAYHGRNIMKACKRAGGAAFSVMAMAYFLFLYPLPVGLGTAAGIMKYITGFRCSAAGSSASSRRRPKDVPKTKKEVSSAIPGHLKGKEVPERLYSR